MFRVWSLVPKGRLLCPGPTAHKELSESFPSYTRLRNALCVNGRLWLLHNDGLYDGWWPAWLDRCPPPLPLWVFPPGSMKIDVTVTLWSTASLSQKQLFAQIDQTGKRIQKVKCQGSWSINNIYSYLIINGFESKVKCNCTKKWFNMATASFSYNP